MQMTDEEVLWPDLPICDPHHHLPDHDHFERWGLGDFLGEIAASGHNIVSTVFVEWLTGYRPEGPEALRYVGETDFARGVAEVTAGGPTRVCAGIVNRADLTGATAPVEAQLDAHIGAGGGRFRGVRHCAGWDASEAEKAALFHDNAVAFYRL